MTVFRWAEEGDRDACLALRREVFVGEQGVTEAEEVDGEAAAALRVIGEADGVPVATLRISRRGEWAKIERVAVARSHRGTGLGHRLMRWTLERLPDQGFEGAVLGAQTVATRFYERLGFVAEGEEFVDARIPHRTMRLRFAGRSET